MKMIRNDGVIKRVDYLMIINCFLRWGCIYVLVILWISFSLISMSFLLWLIYYCELLLCLIILCRYGCRDLLSCSLLLGDCCCNYLVSRMNTFWSYSCHFGTIPICLSGRNLGLSREYEEPRLLCGLLYSNLLAIGSSLKNVDYLLWVIQRLLLCGLNRRDCACQLLLKRQGLLLGCVLWWKLERFCREIWGYWFCWEPGCMLVAMLCRILGELDICCIWGSW